MLLREAVRERSLSFLTEQVPRLLVGGMLREAEALRAVKADDAVAIERRPRRLLQRRALPLPSPRSSVIN